MKLERGGITLHCGDCIEAMRALEDASIDSVVCDPPYHLTSIVKRFGSAGAAPAQFGTDGAFARASRGFMGKEWDGGDIAFQPATWAEALRVLKPGGYLVAFSGTRTYHRMVCAIEDAGFDIRDQLAWVYGSGFPKSLDISKAIDKAAGAEREDLGPGINAAAKTKHALTHDAKGGVTYLSAPTGPRITAPATDAAKQWEGWGTALKPAWEPIVLARKPLIGTNIENVLAHGTGALNIDGCRVATDDGANRARPPRTPNAILGGGKGTNLTASEHNAEGRWPANIVHDGSDEVASLFPQSKDGVAVRHRSGGKNCHSETKKPAMADLGYGGGGSAARFFYAAKASKADRCDSKHPTVKPISLMRWLVRLVTPPGGTVLDPFAGSGTTGAAAVAEGVRVVLCEREPEYQEDIKRRLGLAQLRLPAPLLCLPAPELDFLEDDASEPDFMS